MPRKKVTHECVVCMTEGHERQVFNCRKCTEIVCAKCVGTLALVCECGCPSARYMCPTCRGETAFIVDHVEDVQLLLKLMGRFRSVLSGDGEASDDSASSSDESYEPPSRRRRRRRSDT